MPRRPPSETERLPWFKFFPDKWKLHTRRLPRPIKGTWIDICAELWPTGQVSHPPEVWCRELGLTDPELEEVLTVLRHTTDGEGKPIAVITVSPDVITLGCRWMLAERKARASQRSRVQHHRADATGKET